MAPSQPDGTSDASDLSETVWFRDGAASTYRLTVSTSRFRVVPAVYGILAAEGRGPRAEGRVLVMRRAGTGYRAGQLGLPAGHLDGGEDAVSGLLRELREELAVTVNRDSCHLAVVCHRAPEHPGDGEYLDMFFTVDVWHGTPVIAEPDKCSELVWADRTHLPPDVVDYVAAALTAVVSSWARASVAQPIARAVRTARGPISSWTSDQVPVGQAGSAHRQTRFHQSRRTGLPKHGASAATTRRRPCAVATTPQPGQPVRSAWVSTVTTSRCSPWTTSSTCIPEALNIASARAHQRAPGPHLS